MAAKRKRYPFLFYGVNPSDWFEPEGGAFAYELRFRSAPSSRTTATLTARFRQGLEGHAEALSPFLWAGGRWALVRVRPAAEGPEAAHAAFAAVDRALRQVHALSPLEHAALLDALDLGDDPWDAWTLEEQPAPAPGPRWPHPVALAPDGARLDLPIQEGTDGAARSNTAPAAAAAAGDDDESDDDGDGDGDESDDSASDDASDDESNEAANGGGDEAESGEGGESDESSIAPGRVTFAPLGLARRQKRISPAKPPDEFGEGKIVGTTPAGLAFGWTKRQKRQFTFAWLEHGTLRTTELVASSPGTDVVVRPDGLAALVCPSGKGELWIVSFEDGSARKIWKHPEGDDYFVSIAWAGEGRVVAADFGNLYIVALEGETGRLEKNIGGTSPDGLRSALDGRVLIVSDTDGDAGLTVVGVGPSSFKLLARFEGEFDEPEVGDDGTVIAVRSDGRRYAVRGIEEAYRAAFEGGAAEFIDAPDHEAPADEDLSSPPSPGRPGLLLRRGDDVPRPPALPDNADDLFGDTANVQSTAAGLTFGFVRKPRRPLSFAVLEGGEGGTLRPIALTHSRYGVTMAARPDGRAALTTGPDDHSISEVSFAEGEARLLASELSFHPEALAYLGDDRVAAVGSDSLFLYRRVDGKLEPTARLGTTGTKLYSALGGRFLIVSGWQDPSLKIYGVEGDELRLLVGFSPEIEALVERAGRVYVKPETDRDMYELVELEGAHRLAFSTRDEATYPRLEAYQESLDDDDDDPSSEDEDDDKPPGGHAVEAAPGRVGLRYREGFEPTKLPSMPKDVGKLFGSAGNADFYNGIAYGWKKEARRSFRFAVWREGNFFESPFTATSPSTTVMALRQDGGAALVALANDRELWEVDTHGGQARKLWTVVDEDDELYSIDFLADGHHVVLGTDSVYVLAPAAEGAGSRVLARFGINASDVLVSPDGRAFVLEGVGEGGLYVIGRQGDRFKTLAHFPKTGPDTLREDGGRCFAELDDGAWYELIGIDEAYRAAFESGAPFDDPPPHVVASDDEDEDSDDEDEDSDDSDGDGDGDGDGDDEDSDGDDSEEEEDNDGEDDDEDSDDEDEEDD